MRMVDLIAKKRDGGTHSREELRFIVDGFTGGDIPDYQMSAFLMSVFYKGMEDGETAALTQLMAQSGEMVDLSSIEGVKVDKHSTGGVGDKTTLIAAPIAAACGVKIAKMSGRGLGFTGGTVDKLESIPGFRTELPRQEFLEIVKKTGICVIGQSGNLAPADKKIYALRDVTATVDSIPLIAASIMSKKIAAGNDCILLDVKTGSGAFMKEMEDAVKLADIMVRIGEKAGRRTMALITNMDIPLGRAIGNVSEVREAVETLRGRGPADLSAVCRELAANMIALAGGGEIERCRELAAKAMEDGSAFQKLREMVKAQGGDVSVIDDPESFPKAGIAHEVLAPQDGYLSAMDAAQCGIASMLLGAGRATKESVIDHSAGIELVKKTGEPVKKGEVIARFMTNDESAIAGAEETYGNALSFSAEPPVQEKLIIARVTRDGVSYF
ncbi:pyrimidine-nucleoside phosphorylase [Zongyangia hominis]|uniref:Pyrimidine-nucleoside phosphorylase n=1 Tax=Zongyangia hominis TaxID=2763677 RepID=A0A926EBP9_9FIRM|nr:pyrimidine-nucleoside phosphorylase [Zongyangia hominis]MBC8569419.1 pyrimidine-nucleoside phosphorylase [Zongyangia hominis]